MRLYFTLILCFIAGKTMVQAQQWQQVSSLPDTFSKTHHSFAFAIDDMGYIVTGESDAGPRDDFYKYDADTDSWTALPSFPGPARGYAIGDTWNGKAYFGFGYDEESLLNDFWVFDPSDMSWTELASCPCMARVHPAMVAINGKVFMGMGNGSTGNFNDWWEYDIASDTWTQKTNLPSLERHHPYHFGIDNAVYTGFGHGEDIYNNWFRYDIQDQTWTQVASLPAEGRVAGTQFSYNGIGYVLSGDGEDHKSMLTGEFWAYDPAQDNWEELTPHPGSSRWAPASFIIKGEVYLINGTSFDNYVSDVYKYKLKETVTNAPLLSPITIDFYPNPAKDFLNIKVPEHINFEVRIYNLDGSLIANTNEPVIDIKNVSLGVYLLEIKDINTGHKVIKKWIKSN